MFSRRRRVSRGDFKAALVGRRLSSEHFSVVVPHHASGYAVVLGKQAARLSTERHLVKRRVLAVLESLSLPRGLIVFPKPSATHLSFADLKTELIKLLAPILR
jgi:ribonuclease P protein component